MHTFKSYPVKLILFMGQSSSWFLQQNFIVQPSLPVENSILGVLDEVAVLGTQTLIYIGKLNLRKAFDFPEQSSSMFFLLILRDVVYILYFFCIMKILLRRIIMFSN